MTATQPEGLDMTDEQIRKSMTSEQIQLERKLTCEAIDGAIAFGYQDTNAPPSDEHWLAPFWKIGRKQAELELLSASKPSAMPGKEAVTREQIEAWAKLAGIPTMFEKHIEQLGDFAIFARMDYAASPAAPAQSNPWAECCSYCHAKRDPLICTECANRHAAPLQSGEPIYQEWIGSAWVDVDDVQYAGAQMDKRRIVYATPQPSQPVEAGKTLSEEEIERRRQSVRNSLARTAAKQSAVALDDERAALKSIIDAGRNAKPLHEGGIGENTVYLTPDMYMALSQAPSLAFESALAELVNKIDTGLDSGDLLVDARRALSAIDSILSGGDLVACAHEYFRDSGDRYEKSIEFRIGWDACLDAIVQARAASPQATAMQPAQTERALTDERWKIDAAYAKGYSAGWSNGPYGCAAPLKTTSQKDQAMTREQRNVIAEVATALEMQAEHERNLGIYEGEAMFDDLAKRLNGILTAAQPASDRSAHD
jgi:hypothetical protein